MVANNLRGLRCKPSNCSDDGEPSSSNFTKSLAVSEKNATSDPDTIAEEYSNNNTNKEAPNISKDKANKKGKSRKKLINCKLSDSISKF